MRWKDYFFLFALFSYTVTCNGNSIYLDNISEDLLVESIKLAEKELRIYIYNTSDVNYHNIELKDSLKHFRTEYLFVDYLEMIFQDANHDDHRKKMIVRNPNDANVFIIDHRVFNGKFNSVDEMVLYIRAIIDHVINDLPYYKRNGGEDHYFFGVHSNGNLVTFFLLNFINSRSFLYGWMERTFS